MSKLQKNEITGGILIIAFMAAMACVLFDALDAEAARQITLAMMDRG